MDINKRLKPNLLDPRIEKKIIKTLKPIQEDYWAPTKTTFRSFFTDHIRPNILLLIFLFIVLLFLLYRYRATRTKREINKITKKKVEHCDAECRINRERKNEDADMARELVTLYNQQKEISREPTMTQRYLPLEQVQPVPAAQYAYPMYPYVNGQLVPSNSR